MDRRDFMKACGMPGVCVANFHSLVAVAYAGNVAFSHEQMMALPPDEIKGEGTWWLKIAGNAVTVKLLSKDFHCEIAIVNFSDNVDYVHAMTTRKEPSPLFAEFEKMFGFRE